ncbi:hypothetical protein [Mycobacterium sp. 94-17]|nr:hypothetical protein [Mycobacterium sp. 94-17]
MTTEKPKPKAPIVTNVVIMKNELLISRSWPAPPFARGVATLATLVVMR